VTYFRGRDFVPRCPSYRECPVNERLGLTQRHRRFWLGENPVYLGVKAPELLFDQHHPIPHPAICTCTSASSSRTHSRSAGIHPEIPSRATTATPQEDRRAISPTANRDADEEEVDGGFMRGLVISCCFWPVQQPSQQGSFERV
jgi:hypothetical protein